VEGDAGTDYLNIVYHTPAAKHPDIFPLTVLSTILAGGSGSLVGRGGISNRTSRLYRALVETELAADIDASLVPNVDPGLYRLTATVAPDRTPAEIESVISQEIERLQQETISEAELTKADSRPVPSSRIPARASPIRPSGWASARFSPITPGSCAIWTIWRR
jgi:zinc protease